MSDKPPFNFLKNIWSGGAALLLSDSEQMLLKFALDQFGEPLSQFLLSGLGEERVVPAWLFTVTFTGGQGGRYSRKVRVGVDYRPDMITSVPRNKQPMVVLALLRLLIVDCNLTSSRLHYDQQEVLELLGWKNTPENRLSIDETVRRYTSLYYEWALDKRELAEANLSFFHDISRLISGYDYETIEDAGEVKPTANRIQFNAEFVKELTERSLFGISWNRVHLLDRINC
jgi:hypothetical protein